MHQRERRETTQSLHSLCLSFFALLGSASFHAKAMKVAHLLVLALACVVIAEAMVVPLERVHKTPAERLRRIQRIRDGSARKAVIAKYAKHIRANYPQFAAALPKDLPTDPFKNYDDVRKEKRRQEDSWHTYKHTLFNLSRLQ